MQVYPFPIVCFSHCDLFPLINHYKNKQQNYTCSYSRLSLSVYSVMRYKHVQAAVRLWSFLFLAHSVDGNSHFPLFNSFFMRSIWFVYDIFIVSTFKLILCTWQHSRCNKIILEIYLYSLWQQQSCSTLMLAWWLAELIHWCTGCFEAVMGLF